MKISESVKDQICCMADSLILDLGRDGVEDPVLNLSINLLGSDRETMKRLNALDLMFYQRIPIVLLGKYRKQLKAIRKVYVEERWKKVLKP